MKWRAVRMLLCLFLCVFASENKFHAKPQRKTQSRKESDWDLFNLVEEFRRPCAVDALQNSILLERRLSIVNS